MIPVWFQSTFPFQKKSLDEVITEIVTKQIPGNSGQRCMLQTRTFCDLPWLGVHLPRHYRLWTSSYVVIMEKPWWQFANSTRLYIHTNRKHNVWLPRPPVQSSPRKSSTRSSPSKLLRNKGRPPKKKTVNFMTICQLQLPPTLPTQLWQKKLWQNSHIWGTHPPSSNYDIWQN